MKEIFEELMASSAPDEVKLLLKELIKASIKEAFEVKSEWDRNGLINFPYEQFEEIVLSKNEIA